MNPNDLLTRIQTNIYKRKLRGGGVSWMVRWKSPRNGRWVAVTGGRTKSEAQALEARIRNELVAGRDPEFLKTGASPDLTVSDVIDRFFEHSRYLAGTETWKVENRSRLEQWVRPNLGKFKFSDLTTDRILKFYLSMRDGGLGRPSITKTHTLVCLLGDLHAELVPRAENVARKIRDFGKYFPKRAPQREINFLVPEEMEVLFRAADRSKNHLLSPLIRFLAETGLRRSEALNLKWTDIDRAGGFIHIRKSKNGRARRIPLVDEAWRAIERLYGRSEYVFVDRSGKRPHEDVFLKPLRTAARKAGIEKRIDLHTFRHSYGSNKLRAGWGLKKVSMLLGHSDISITANVYAHLTDGDLCVRDDFRFDNPAESENSHELGNLREMIADSMASAVIKALQELPAGEDALLRVKSELARLAESAEFHADSESSRKIAKVSPRTEKKLSGATPVLHGAAEGLNEGSKTKADDSGRWAKSLSDLEGLNVSERNGRPTRIRYEPNLLY